jgi:uncharacterized protein (DUF2236 family)
MEIRGFFGPDSVSWRLHSEPVLWVGGLRSLVLQALHPVAMRGVADHSDYRTDPWGRLRRTATYVGSVTYGSTEEAERTADRIRRLHERLGGIDPVTGRHYRVDDPDLLLWVHACLVDSFLTTARRSGVRISAAEADRYVAEQVIAAELVGIPAADTPPTVADLDAYLLGMVPELKATPEAREVARLMVVPPMPTWVQLATPARPAWFAVGSLALALLPRWARRMLRLPGLPITDSAATAALRGLRLVTSVAPQSMREGPALRAARQRLALDSAAPSPAARSQPAPSQPAPSHAAPSHDHERLSVL